MEQEEYTKEEIDWSYIEFVDNQDVLDLIEKVKYLFCFFILEFSSFFPFMMPKLDIEYQGNENAVVNFFFLLSMMVYVNGCTCTSMYII